MQKGTDASATIIGARSAGKTDKEITEIANSVTNQYLANGYRDIENWQDGAQNNCRRLLTCPIP